jgi:glycosyltransferase involved in cell wall biosynthesis
MLRVLMLVNWPIVRRQEFDPNIRIADQLVLGKRYWFSSYWPSNVNVDVVGIDTDFPLYPLESRLKIYVQHAKALSRISAYDLILTHDSGSAFVVAILRSKIAAFGSIPHVMIEVGLPGAPERRFRQLPLSLKYGLLKTVFNTKTVSHIVFHSSCQRLFYARALGFPEERLSYVPFGVETDYFKPEPLSTEGYIFTAGEFRDFLTLLNVYRRWHEKLPELRIRSGLPKPKNLPPNVKFLPRAPISIFKQDALRARFVVLPVHYTLRSTGLMTLLQCMALAKAVIVSRVPAVDGYVIDGKTALYYTPYDAQDLFRKISLLVNEDKLVHNLGREARREVEENFDIQRMGTELWGCVSRVLREGCE